MEAENYKHNVYYFMLNIYQRFIKDQNKFESGKFTYNLDAINSEIIIDEQKCKVSFFDFTTSVQFPNGEKYFLYTSTNFNPIK